MQNQIHHIEARKAWEDTGSWRAGLALRRHHQGVVVEIDGEELCLRWKEPLSIQLPDRLAYSRQRGLLAAAHPEGQVISLAPDHGVFAMLGGGDRYLFIRVVPADPPEAAAACTMCRYPTGFDGDALCEGHARLGMGNVFRGSRFGKAERAAGSAAFDRDPARLRVAIEELAGLAFPLEAHRLVDKFTPAIDQFEEPTVRASLITSLVSLVRLTGDRSLVDSLQDQAKSESQGVSIFHDPIPRHPSCEIDLR